MAGPSISKVGLHERHAHYPILESWLDADSADDIVVASIILLNRKIM